MNLVSLRNVKKSYVDGKTVVEAVRGVDLDIAEGEFAALAGPSGSGKTTLLNLIGCLDAVGAGRIELGGRDITALPLPSLYRIRLYDIGFVFQSYNLVPVLSARENVEFTMLLQGVAATERRRRALEILDRVGLSDYADRRPSAMSGGQQQRVAVARAIVTRPRIVLADEPTANLDSETGGRLLDVMRALNKSHGVTFLFSTHDPMVMEYSRRLIRLRDGLIASDERR